jgi:glycosyltransferase involved in cell wall biosynthesis
MAPVKISAVIITFNEEKNIKRCITSLQKVADEIVVVDSFSKDKTEEICRLLNVSFLQNSFEGHIQQKNFAMHQASFDIILALDADEELSQELEQSILSVKTDWQGDAYRMNRLTSYCGKWIRFCGWYPDNKIRLWDRRKGNWKGENPHDRVVMDDNQKGVAIAGDICHYSYNSFSELVNQTEKFSTIAANEAFINKKKIFFPFHVVVYPLLRFLNVYFLKLGLLDGKEGFVISIMDSFYRFSKYNKLHSLQRKR